MPNDLMTNLDPLSLIILLPIMDIYVFPWLLRNGIDLLPIKRITLGYILIGMSMLWTCVIQYWIDYLPLSSVSIWWQAPVYIIVAFSEGILLTNYSIRFGYFL